LTVALEQTIARTAVQTTIRTLLEQQVAGLPGARLLTMTVVPQPDVTVVWAVIRIPRPVSPQQATRLNDLVNRAVGRPVDLRVRSVITVETTRSGYVYTPELSPDEDPTEPIQ